MYLGARIFVANLSIEEDCLLLRIVTRRFSTREFVVHAQQHATAHRSGWWRTQLRLDVSGFKYDGGGIAGIKQVLCSTVREGFADRGTAGAWLRAMGARGGQQARDKNQLFRRQGGCQFRFGPKR
jgi:hypothetical protein